MASAEVKDLERELSEVKERYEVIHGRVVESSGELAELEEELRGVTVMYR